MDTGTAVIFRRTVLTIIGIRRLLTRLLQRPTDIEKDLESQIPSPPPTFKDESHRSSSRSPFQSPTGRETASDKFENHSIASGSRNRGEVTPEEVPYAEAPTRIFLHNDGDLHNDGESKDVLACLVTKEMVCTMQEVINDKQALQKIEKLLDKLERKAQKTQKLVIEFESRIVDAESGDEAQNLEQQLECLRLKAQEAHSEKDSMTNRLRVLKLNLELSKDAVQNFFENLFSDAGLLDAPCQESEREPEETGSSTNKSNVPESSPPNPEELFRQMAEEDLFNKQAELRKTQEEWDNWSNFYDSELEEYKQLLADGEPVPTQSVFDQCLLYKRMELNTYLVKTGKAYDMALEHAVAAGPVHSDFGKPVYFDEFCLESWTNEEAIAHQQTKDWSRVYEWLQRIPTTLDEELISSIDTDALDEIEDPNISTLEPMEIDEWEVETIDLGQDSVSVIAFDAYQSKNLKRWQEMRGHR